MTRWLTKNMALSEAGAKDLLKGMMWSALSFLSFMFPMVVLISFLDELVTPVLSGGTASPDLLKYAALCILAIIVMIPFNWLQFGSLFIATYKESANKRILLAEKLRKLPLSFFGQRDIADLTSTIMSDCTGMEHVFSHVIPQMGGSVISILVITVFLFFMDWRIALALFWVFPISLLFIFGSRKMQHRAGRKHSKAKMECIENIQECLETVREIKAYNYKDDYLSDLYHKLDKTEQSQMKYELIMDAFLGAGQAFLRVGLATVVLAGGSLFITGKTSFLVFFIFLMAATRIYDPLSGALTMITEIFNAKLKIERIQSIENYPIQDGDTEYRTKGYDICFDDVSFHYNENKTVLNHVSFTARQGEITALVGPSGSGKSTAAKLAARFWDTPEGTISLGGADIKTIYPEKLLENYAIVFQDVILFNQTIMENIRMGRRNAEDEEVITAAKIAQCESFIGKLPEGYETVIGENGAKLSGGERQRLSIARAILKDSPVVLLDEATASLDVESETLVQEAISKLIKGKTVLIIAHRMRTVAGAHKIIVFKEGEIVQQGTPADLVKQQGLYQNMVRLQQENEQWTV